jgi:hypothetical protein
MESSRGLTGGRAFRARGRGEMGTGKMALKRGAEKDKRSESTASMSTCLVLSRLMGMRRGRETKQLVMHDYKVPKPMDATLSKKKHDPK